MGKSNRVTSDPRASTLSRRSVVVSKPGAAMKVEVFRLTDEEKAGLTLKGRLSDVKVYSDKEWKKIKQAA